MTKKRRDFMSDVVLPFSDVKKSDFNSVGNKALNLSLLKAEGFQVPYGFVVTTGAYEKFIIDNNFKEKISDLLKSTKFDYKKSLVFTSKNIQGLILSGEILSHGAVVSREYGIPAVTAVSNATKIFKMVKK